MKIYIPVIKTSVLAVSLVLVGCGGGSGDGTSVNTQPITLSGKVADGYLQLAKVCLDINANNLCDEGEPYNLSGTGGDWAIAIDAETRSNLGNIEQYSLVAEAVAGQTIDEDDNLTLENGYILTSTYDTYKFISPITTLIKHQIDKEGDSLDEAVKKLQEQTGISDINILTDDYIAAELDGSSSYAERIHALAKAVVLVKVTAEQQYESLNQITISADTRAAFDSVIMDFLLYKVDQLFAGDDIDSVVTELTTPEIMSAVEKKVNSVAEDKANKQNNPNYDSNVQAIFDMADISDVWNVASSMDDFSAENLRGIRPTISTKLSNWNGTEGEMALYPPSAVTIISGEVANETTPLINVYGKKSSGYKFYEFSYIDSFPEGDWLLKAVDSSETKATFSFSASNPFSSHGDILVPTLKVNADGSTITSIDVQWYLYDTDAASYTQAPETLMQSIVEQDVDGDEIQIALRTRYGSNLATFVNDTWSGNYTASGGAQVTLPESGVRFNLNYNIGQVSYQFLFQ